MTFPFFVRQKFIRMFLVINILFTPMLSFAWGFLGHKKINRFAVFTLPPEMVGFYKKHIEIITNNAVNADKRRYVLPNEEPRHYIDIDYYTEDARKINKVIPINWKDAVEKFSEDTLNAYGIVPWHVNFLLYQLTKAFEEKNQEDIIRISTDIGHYIADAHVPLHTTQNYNGQLTNQKGIHGLWESRLVELNQNEYDYFVDRCKYIDKPLKDIWRVIKESFTEKGEVLKLEKQLTAKFGVDQKYSFETLKSTTKKVYSVAFSQKYNDLLGSMVEDRLKAAIYKVASYWYTAWVNAGQPNLDTFPTNMENPLLTEKENYTLWNKGRKHTYK